MNKIRRMTEIATTVSQFVPFSSAAIEGIGDNVIVGDEVVVVAVVVVVVDLVVVEVVEEEVRDGKCRFKSK
jgi:hypothetical protein